MSFVKCFIGDCSKDVSGVCECSDDSTFYCKEHASDHFESQTEKPHKAMKLKFFNPLPQTRSLVIQKVRDIQRDIGKQRALMISESAIIMEALELSLETAIIQLNQIEKHCTNVIKLALQEMIPDISLENKIEAILKLRPNEVERRINNSKLPKIDFDKAMIITSINQLFENKDLDPFQSSFNKSITSNDHLNALQTNFRDPRTSDKKVSKLDNANLNNADDCIKKGNALKGLGKNEEAIEFYNEAIRLKPDHAEAYYKKGLALDSLERYEEAVECYNEAIRIKPDHGNVYLWKGVSIKNLGRKEEAIECYDEAIKLKPDYANAHFFKGVALNDLDRKSEALECFNKSISLEPNDAASHKSKGCVLYDLGRKEEAIECYNEAIRLQPDYAYVFYNKGNALKDLGRKEEAIECYNEAFRLEPDTKLYISARSSIKDPSN